MLTQKINYDILFGLILSTINRHAGRRSQILELRRNV